MNRLEMSYIGPKLMWEIFSLSMNTFSLKDAAQSWTETAGIFPGQLDVSVKKGRRLSDS